MQARHNNVYLFDMQARQVYRRVEKKITALVDRETSQRRGM